MDFSAVAVIEWVFKSWLAQRWCYFRYLWGRKYDDVLPLAKDGTLGIYFLPIITTRIGKVLLRLRTCLSLEILTAIFTYNNQTLRFEDLGPSQTLSIIPFCLFLLSYITMALPYFLISSPVTKYWGICLYCKGMAHTLSIISSYGE